MLYNSIRFFVFFGVIFSLYCLLRNNHKRQNRLLLFASYFFYGCWDWRFLSLIFISTAVDYFCGLKIAKSRLPIARKLFLTLSIFTNLSLLVIFKYFNFFSMNFSRLLDVIGLPTEPYLLQIILPVGISFYTFQTLSYTIDIFKRQIKPTKNFLDFALFVSFFPQLVAGPIERAKNLLPQILNPRILSLKNFYEGSYLIFWGLFLKIFIADNLAPIVNNVYSVSGPYNGGELLYATYAFAFQIFCDFAGYSKIARGLGKCMGFDIMLNFNNPYLATNPSDFWNRWHISLSTWIRDYIYIPLGGSRFGTLLTYRNIIIAMVLCGAWHGASLHFIFWGLFHAFLLIGYRMLKPALMRIPIPDRPWAQNLWFIARVVFFFHVTCVGWLIFRATSMTQAFQMLHDLVFNFDIGTLYYKLLIGRDLIMYVWLLVLIKIIAHIKNDLLFLLKSRFVLRAVFYYICFYLMIIYGISNGQEFIYFQF